MGGRCFLGGRVFLRVWGLKKHLTKPTSPPKNSHSPKNNTPKHPPKKTLYTEDLFIGVESKGYFAGFGFYWEVFRGIWGCLCFGCFRGWRVEVLGVLVLRGDFFRGSFKDGNYGISPVQADSILIKSE